MRRISCEIKKAAAPHTRDRQPALPPKLASACRGNSPLISVNAGSTLYLTMQSFRSNPDLRDLSCPLRHFPSLAQSSEAGSTTRTWKLSPSASSLGCRHSSTFPLQCLSDMHISWILMDFSMFVKTPAWILQVSITAAESHAPCVRSGRTFLKISV